MSVSHYTSQVNRLSADAASLRRKLADERQKLVDNSKALKAVEYLNSASSPSQFTSRARDVERHQKAAAAYEKRAADVEKRLVDKEKALSSVQASLERARREQQRKDDREAEERRKADLDHIRRLEHSRRQGTTFPVDVQPRTIPARPVPPREPVLDETFDPLSHRVDYRSESRRRPEEALAGDERVLRVGARSQPWSRGDRPGRPYLRSLPAQVFEER